ncbi:unnamed protein product [Arabidopsis lyrata]|uniref:Expressed protein n=1 Tax=Arabidopsis lyrata subsp. lyrata TaxID=81972 RepID=D7KMN2_ARALL|nr:expressed protein [Arabidopsis lyrata subsp. lyrata]CAH8253281.1 unnamed protein product [Arabidopsis lyrata]
MFMTSGRRSAVISSSPPTSVVLGDFGTSNRRVNAFEIGEFFHQIFEFRSTNRS